MVARFKLAAGDGKENTLKIYAPAQSPPESRKAHDGGNGKKLVGAIAATTVIDPKRVIELDEGNFAGF